MSDVVWKMSKLEAARTIKGLKAGLAGRMKSSRAAMADRIKRERKSTLFYLKKAIERERKEHSEQLSEIVKAERESFKAWERAERDKLKRQVAELKQRSKKG